MFFFFLHPFFGKKKFYVHTQIIFGGALLTLMYLSTLKEEFDIIFHPFELFKKKKFYNFLIFKIAYLTIKKKKINSVTNFFHYLFYLSIKNKKNFNNLRIKNFHHRVKKSFNNLMRKKNIFFDYKEKTNNYYVNELLRKEYILFHIRDEKYKKMISNFNLQYHSYRNSNLDNLVKGLSRFKNLLFIRFGSVGEKKCENQNIFDYTFSNFRSEENDLLLMKNCKFFIGQPSGPDTLAINFMKPIVYIDWVHLPNLFTFKENAIVTFKKIFNKTTNKFIPFNQLLDMNFKIGDDPNPVGLYYKSEQYNKSNLEVIGSSPDEISQAVEEMNNLIDGKLKVDLNLQNLFFKSFKEKTNLPISNNFFISEYFIKNNLELFQ